MNQSQDVFVDDEVDRQRNRRIREMLRDGVIEETKHQAGAYLHAYLNGWPEDTRVAQLRQKLRELKAAHLKAIEIVDELGS